MEKITLSKKDRLSVAWRHQFLQGSWNYERMQNGGVIPSSLPLKSCIRIRMTRLPH